MSASIISAHRRLVLPVRVLAAVGAILVAAGCSTDSPATGNTASTIAISSGSGQTGMVTTALTAPLSVAVADEAGNPISGATVTFVATGGATLGSSTATTNSSGIAQSTVTLGQHAGVDTVTATASGTSGSVQFLETAGAGAATAVAISSGNNQTGTHSTMLGAPLVVVVTDQFGNVVPNANVTWTSTFGSLGTASSISDSTGKAQTTWTLPAIVSTDSATARLGGTTSTAIFSAMAN